MFSLILGTQVWFGIVRLGLNRTKFELRLNRLGLVKCLGLVG